MHRIIASFMRTSKWKLIKLFFLSSQRFQRPELTKLVYYIIFILIIVKNCLLYIAIHDFTEYPTTGSNPVDIKRFWSQTGKKLYYFVIIFSTGIRDREIKKHFLTNKCNPYDCLFIMIFRKFYCSYVEITIFFSASDNDL